MLIEGVALAMRLASDLGRPLTQKLHVQLAKQHPGRVPTPSVVADNARKHGMTAKQLREEAARRTRAAP